MQLLRLWTSYDCSNICNASSREIGLEFIFGRRLSSMTFENFGFWSGGNSNTLSEMTEIL